MNRFYTILFVLFCLSFGTFRVKAQFSLAADVIPGATGSGPTYLTTVGDSVYFLAGNEGDSNRDLWMYDGTIYLWHQIKMESLA